MRLVKFTDLQERDVWVNPDRVDGLYPSGDIATGITASGSEDNLFVRGKPAEVAARLAGESPQVDDPEMVPMSIFQATQQKLAAAEEGRAEVESHLQDAADALTAAEARASVTEQQRDQARAERDNFARRVNSLTDEVDGLRSEILRLSTSAFTNEEQHERDLAALTAERDALKAELADVQGGRNVCLGYLIELGKALGVDTSGRVYDFGDDIVRALDVIKQDRDGEEAFTRALLSGLDMSEDADGQEIIDSLFTLKRERDDAVSRFSVMEQQRDQVERERDEARAALQPFSDAWAVYVSANGESPTESIEDAVELLGYLDLKDVPGMHRWWDIFRAARNAILAAQATPEPQDDAPSVCQACQGTALDGDCEKCDGTGLEPAEEACATCDDTGKLSACREQCTLGPNGGYCPGDGVCPSEGEQCPDCEPAEEAGEEGAESQGTETGSVEASEGNSTSTQTPTPEPAPATPTDSGYLCATCGGSGDASNGADCPTCEGTGSTPDPLPDLTPTDTAPTTGTTTDWPADVPASTSGLTLAFTAPQDVKILPSVRDRYGSFARGCPAVIYLRNSDVRFHVIPDHLAKDGAARGDFRYCANQPTIWPAPGSWSPDSTFLGQSTPPLFPIAGGALSVASLVTATGVPIGTHVDAAGNQWVRFDFWSDDAKFRTDNYKTHSASAATHHWLCVPKDWDSVPAPPEEEYAFGEPIALGSSTVHGVKFRTNAMGRTWSYGPGVPGLYADRAEKAQRLAKILSIPEWRARLEKAQADPHLLKLDPRGAGHRFDGLQNSDQHSYWDLAIPYALTGKCASKPLLRKYPMDTHMNVPRIGAGGMEDNAMPARSGKGYDEVEAPIAVAFGVAACEPTFRFERDPEGWTAVEVFRIRETLACYAHEGLLRNRVNYSHWKTPAGNSYAMWTTALNEAAQVIGETMPDYSSPQYGKASDWVAFAKGETRLGLPVGTGRLGLIEQVPVGPVSKKNVYGHLDPAIQNPKGVVWRGGGYDQPHLCLGPTAIVDSCFGMVGAHEKAWIGWIDQSLPGAQNKHVEAALCNSQNQAYYDAVLASGVTQQDIVNAAVKESGDAGNGFAMFRMLKALS